MPQILLTCVQFLFSNPTNIFESCFITITNWFGSIFHSFTSKKWTNQQTQYQLYTRKYIGELTYPNGKRKHINSERICLFPYPTTPRNFSENSAKTGTFDGFLPSSNPQIFGSRKKQLPSSKVLLLARGSGWNTQWKHNRQTGHLIEVIESQFGWLPKN